MNESDNNPTVRVTDAAYRELNQMTLAGWLDYHQREVVFDKVSWMGIPTLKNVMDLWVYQELLYRVRPELVIEMGSFKGGSTLYLAQLLELIGGAGEVVSVDIDHSHFQARHPRITLLTGSTRAPETIARLQELAAGRRVMIIHDADHARDTVLADLLTYADLVSRDSYFIVEDGVVDLFPPDTLLGGVLGGPGPLPAVREFLEQDRRFVIDRDCQRYHLTYNPDGYLKKIAE
jgi:cephalosporin hydroxylase